MASPLAQVVLKIVNPIAGGLAKIFRIVAPVSDIGLRVAEYIWKFIKPYHPEEFLPAFGGLILVFFGGKYMTLIAAVEAFRLTGWDRTRESFVALYKEYKKGVHAYKRDDLVDDDRDGIPDVHQIDKETLVKRKAMVVANALDPNILVDAFGGIYSGLIGVLATLKIEFAQVITLGASIGDIFWKAADSLLRPLVSSITPKEYHKWISPTISIVSKWAGAALAFYCFRVVRGFYSSIRGAQIFALAVQSYLNRHHNTRFGLGEGGAIFTLFTTVLGYVGFYWQLSHGFKLPFPLNMFLLPFTIMENYLVYLLGVDRPPKTD